MRIIGTRTGLLLAALLGVANTGASSLPADVVQLLRKHAGFTDQEIQVAQRGDRFVRMLDTQSQAEVAFVGVTKLPISIEKYLERVRKGTLYKVDDTILQVGRFSETPSVQDLQRLRFQRYDTDRFGGSGEEREQAERANREMLVELIRQYEKSGMIATGPLGERPRPVDVETFAPMVQASGYLRERLPAAYEYLLRYPNVPGRGLDDYYLWKEMTFGFRPLTRIAQVAVWEQNKAGQHEAVILTKQIYANRYFESSFQVDHVIADRSDPDNPAVFLVTLNRGRSEFLEGTLGKLIRPTVLSRTRTATEKALDKAKRDLEAEYRRHIASSSTPIH